MVSEIGGSSSSLSQMFMERTFPKKEEELDPLKAKSKSGEDSNNDTGLERTVQTTDFAGALRDMAELEQAAVKDNKQPMIAIGGQAESMQPAHMRMPANNFWQLQVSGASFEE